MTDETRGQREGRHWVDGRWTSCCEDGETNCPCTCHDQTAEDHQ